MSDYSNLTNEEIASDYLQQKAKAKEASALEKTLKEVLDARLKSGDELMVGGVLYRWTVTIGRSPAYKKAIDFAMSKVGPDVQVILDEAVEVTTGPKTTKELKAAD